VIVEVGMTDQATPQRETSPAERTGYSLYFAGQNIVYTLIQGYLLMFYVSYMGLNPALPACLPP
jgi:Na+/melibiose symporter-like transporter